MLCIRSGVVEDESLGFFRRIGENIALTFRTIEDLDPAQIPTEQTGLTMAVAFHIPGAFANSLADAVLSNRAFRRNCGRRIRFVVGSIPGVRDRVANEQGQIRQHINVFIGNENIRYTGGLTSRIPNGSEISIVPAVSGGRPENYDCSDSNTLSIPVANSPAGVMRLKTR